MIYNQNLISIIIPVFNAENYLCECMDSIINQTYTNLEIICVNDGSVDNSQKILDEYAKKDNRIIVINQENLGSSGARNTGLEQVNGDYIMFVDCDDWVDLNICENLLNVALFENADSAMCSYVKEFNKKSVINHLFPNNYVVFEKEEVKNVLYRKMFGLIGEELSKPQDGDLIISPTMQLFKSELCKGVKFVDLNKIGTFEDGLFQIMIYDKCKRFAYIDKPFYHYRKTNNLSLTTKYKADLFEKWQNLFDILHEIIKTKCLDKTFQMALNNRIALSMIGLGLNEIHSNKNVFAQAKRLKQFLKTQRYKDAYSKLDFKHFPFTWKVFFKLCKYKMITSLCLMIFIIDFLRKKPSTCHKNNSKSNNVFLLTRYFLDPDKKHEVLKYDDQISALENMGYNVFYLGVTEKEVFLCNKDKRQKIKNIYFDKIPIVSKIATYLALYKSTKKSIDIIGEIDFAYVRNSYAIHSFIKAVKVLKKASHNKVAVEIPTYPPNKEEMSDIRFRRKVMYKILHIMEKRLVPFTNLFVLIGEKANSYLGKPAINIDNGINIKNIHLREQKEHFNEYHILTLAKMARWHGYDRLIRGLNTYYKNNNNRNVYIHMVGPDGDGSLKKWEQLSTGLGLQDYIFFYGLQSGASLDQIVNKCDLACDSMGMYTKNLNTSSSLKIREYVARGIPFLYATKDNAIDDTLPFWLLVDDNDKELDFVKIIDFINKTRKIDNIQGKMREYAQNYMTWERQFEKVINTMEGR